VLRRNIEQSETRQGVTQQMLEMEEILERVRMRVDQQILEMEEMVQSVQLAVLLEQAEENTQRIENLMSS